MSLNISQWREMLKVASYMIIESTYMMQMIPFFSINSITGFLLTGASLLDLFIEDESAVVQGVVTQDGLFDGSVVTRFEEYYIEPTSRYLNKNEDTSPPYHSIAYRTSDVTTPPHPLPCASHQLHQEKSLRDSFDR